MTAEPDPYMALDLAPGSSLEQVKEQYRRLAKEHHPDLNPQDRARSEERLRRLNAAYAVLSDPAHKAMLDFRWEQTRAAGAQPPGPRARPPRRPAAHPRPMGTKDAKRQRPKAATAGQRKAARALTREERKRVRIAATSLGLMLSLTVVGVVYYEWAQPTPPNRIGIAPSLGGGGINEHSSMRVENWPPPARVSSDPPVAPAQFSPPPFTSAPGASDAGASDAGIAIPTISDPTLTRIKGGLQQRLDAADPKIRLLAAEAQTEAADDARLPAASPARVQWRAQLLADSRAMLLQRDTVRLEVESLSSSEPKMPQAAMTQIKIDSQDLERQYRQVLTEVRQRPN